MERTIATETLPAYFEFSPISQQLTSQLCIVPMNSGSIQPLVKLSGAAAPAEQIGPWVNAFGRARHRLDDELPVRDWWAAIGATGERRSDQALQSATEIGGMSLKPIPHAYEDVAESTIPSLNGWQVHHSFPVVVSGADSGYSFTVTQQAAADRLGRLCAVLSVVWDSCWRIRHTPQEFPLDPIHLPRGRVHQPDVPHSNWSRTEVGVPDWVNGALALMERDDQTLMAVRAHHQGTMMEDQFPSYALLAYVAVIEGVGARYVPLQRCDCCKSCSVNVGAGKRFRTALGIVLPLETARSLSKAYTQRSLTAHEGRLHGGEELFGTFRESSLFSQQDSDIFRYHRVGLLRHASRQLLILALTGELPDLSSVVD